MLRLRVNNQYDRKFMDNWHLMELARVWSYDLVESIEDVPSNPEPRNYRDTYVKIHWNYERTPEIVTRREFETLMRGVAIYRDSLIRRKVGESYDPIWHVIDRAATARKERNND